MDEFLRALHGRLEPGVLDRDALTRRLGPHASDLVHRELRCFWVLEYRVG